MALKLRYEELVLTFAFNSNAPLYDGATPLSAAFALGQAVQVEPMTPALKAPGSMLLTL
jgi:hypothetical protein